MNIINDFKYYLVILKATLKEKVKFKLNNIIFLVSSTLITAFLTYYLWKYVSINQNNTTFNSHEILIYALLLATINTCVIQDSDFYFASDIKSGDISMILVKPMFCLKQYFIKTLAKASANMLLIFLPILLIIMLMYPLKLSNILLGIISLFLSISLVYIIDILFGIFTIKLMNSWGLNLMKSLFMSLFTGALIPIFLLPSVIVLILKYSPFYFISYPIIQIFMNKLTLMMIVKVLLIQLIWIIILSVLVLILWNYLHKKIQVNGG